MTYRRHNTSHLLIGFDTLRFSGGDPHFNDWPVFVVDQAETNESYFSLQTFGENDDQCPVGFESASLCYQE